MSNLQSWKYDLLSITIRLNTLTLPFLYWYLILILNDITSRNTQLDYEREGQLLLHLVHNSRSVALLKSVQALSLRGDLFDPIRRKLKADKNRVATWTKCMQSVTDDVPITFGHTQMKKIVATELGITPSQVEDIFEFVDGEVRGASIGQVYKAKVKPGPVLRSLVGRKVHDEWAGSTVALKVQRPKVDRSISMDVFLITEAAYWMEESRAGDVRGIASGFGEGLFGELDYRLEALNANSFKEVYGELDNVVIPSACEELSTGRVCVMEWVEGVGQGSWGDEGMDMVRVGIRCCVKQMLDGGYFHADPHRGNLLMTEGKELAFVDFGMMARVSAEDRYGLIGLVFGLQNKDLELITENLLKLGFLEDKSQLEELIPRLRKALKNATGGTGKARDMNFASLQAELNEISRENRLKFYTPPFFTTIIRTLTILEGLALQVDPDFRLVKGAYPFVLAQLLSKDFGGSEWGLNAPPELRSLLTRVLVNRKTNRIEWERLNGFLRLADGVNLDKQQSDGSSSASKSLLTPSKRDTIELFARFLASESGLFLKEPLVQEIAEVIDSAASSAEINIAQITGGFLRPPPGGGGPVDESQLRGVQKAIEVINTNLNNQADPTSGEGVVSFLQSVVAWLVEVGGDETRREEARVVLEAGMGVAREVAAEVLERRTKRAVREAFGIALS